MCARATAGRRGWLGSLLLLAGCGYVGDPQPPALDIPQAVRDLRAMQYGSQITAEFTIEAMTTEGLPLVLLQSVDLYAGPAGEASVEAWANEARRYAIATAKPGPVAFETEAALWTGKAIELRVRTAGPKGRPSGWSNVVRLEVGQALERPAQLQAANTAPGVRLTWTGGGPRYRVFRATDGQPELAGETGTPEFIDAAIQYGTAYRYQVQSFANALWQGELTAEAVITPQDLFPPEVPAGLSALAAAEAIELAWQPESGEDFAAYRVYRAEEGAEWVLLNGEVRLPSFTDRAARAGVRYRYAVSSVDLRGNESVKSGAVDAALP